MEINSTLTTDNVIINTRVSENTQENRMYTENTGTDASNDIVVSAGRLPGHVREYVIPYGSTVGYVLGLVDPTIPNVVSSGVMFVRKNAVEAGLNEVLYNGDVVQVAKNVQGNMNINSAINFGNVQVNTSVVTEDTITENNRMNTENIVVSAGRLPGHVREFVVPVGSTVEYVLGLVDPTLPGVVTSGVMFVRKNAVEAELYESVSNGDVVQAAKNVQGN